MMVKYRSKQRLLFFFSSRRRHTRFKCDWSSDVCSSDLIERSRNQPALWPAAAPRDSARARHQTQVAAPGRTGRWIESVRAGRPDESDSADQGTIWAYDFACRAQYEGGHGSMRPNTGCRLWQVYRTRVAPRDQERPESD